MKIVFLSYNPQPGYSSPGEWVSGIRNFAAVMELLSARHHIYYIKPINYEGAYSQNGVHYTFIKPGKRKAYFPVKLHKKVKELFPDIIIVSGLRVPLQVIHLKRLVGNTVKIIGRHHAEAPPTGIRRVFQRMADHSFNAYLFTAAALAGEWIRAGIIKKGKIICEIPAASTSFIKQDKMLSRQRTGMKGDRIFLWVGRLNANKDPMTILEGFEKYLHREPGARLYMIFQEDDLLGEMKQRIKESRLLSGAVILSGRIHCDELPYWYSAADFYITGSHREGGSFALLEAMACGCIPVVTAIPAAIQMTGNGKMAVLFEPGNVSDLAEKLKSLDNLPAGFSLAVESYFRENLSSRVIAEKIHELAMLIQSK